MRACSWLALALACVAPLRASSADPASAPQPTATPQPTLTEMVTVTATSNPTELARTAGSVDRVERSEIESRLVSDSRELMAFLPGVTVAGSPTRLGLGGFVIRGIGGNRVATRIDGVAIAEEFNFGPLGVQRFGIDPELLQSVEVVRSAGSALYGSDALGGVVSLLTRDPADYLNGAPHHLGGRLGWDGRDQASSASAQLAFGGEVWSGSLALDGSEGEATDNQGEDESLGAARTSPNPMERRSIGALAKLVYQPSERLRARLVAERFDGDTETDVLSSRTFQNLGPVFGPGVTYSIDTSDFTADDRLARTRFSLDLDYQLGRGWADTATARLFVSNNENDQQVHERVVTRIGGGPLGPLRTSDLFRDGVFRLEQDITGLEVQLRRVVEGASTTHLITWGVAAERERFDMLRDRVDTNALTGTEVVPSTLVPTEYFPRSDVDTLSLFVQDEIDLLDGRLRLVPGLRFDRSALDADQTDPIFLAGNPGTPVPVDATAEAISPKLAAVVAVADRVSLFAQYARGFRTAPYHTVNNGFSNAASGYQTLPNPDLDPETSDNVEAGARFGGGRASASVTLFENRYDDFIEQVAIGVNPATGLLEYQYRNLTSARIHGVEFAGDARLGASVRLRAAAAWIEGENGETDQPLNNISPPRAVLGLDWTPAALPVDAGLVVTWTAEKDSADLDRTVVNQFATPAATVVDLVAAWRFAPRWTLQTGVFNVFDEVYWEWGDVGGLAATSPVLDRYTAAGRNVAATLRVRW